MLHRLAIKIDWNDRGTRWLIAILVLSLFLNLYGAWWGLPFPAPPSWGSVRSNFWWAYDTIAPISPLAGARDLFAWGTVVADRGDLPPIPLRVAGRDLYAVHGLFVAHRAGPFAGRLRLSIWL